MENTVNIRVSKPKPVTGKYFPGYKHPGLEKNIWFCEVEGNDKSGRGEE